jgi:hypothetical protein
MGDFESWFGIMSEKVRALGYHGPIDKDAFEDDYNNDKSPEKVAEELFKEMTE